ncbi:MAG: hypothetical protein KC591_03030 [Gemmatimonadetes bacterium]|nr:hypothetical protein [Gemmatimonadota bacterium]
MTTRNLRTLVLALGLATLVSGTANAWTLTVKLVDTGSCTSPTPWPASGLDVTVAGLGSGLPLTETTDSNGEAEFDYFNPWFSYNGSEFTVTIENPTGSTSCTGYIGGYELVESAGADDGDSVTISTKFRSPSCDLNEDFPELCANTASGQTIIIYFE